MIEILRHLRPNSRVLDLGSAGGSFPSGHAWVIRLDLESPPNGGLAVRADAAWLPFRDHSIDAVISNHSFEHFNDPVRAAREVGRVIRPEGSLYVTVPDSTTFSDRLYRWLGRGGGHVNPFRAEAQLRELLERATGLVHRGSRLLYGSFVYLGPRSRRGRWQWKLLLFLGAPHAVVALGAGLLRWADSQFGCRLSAYGWEYYFGPAALAPPLGESWTNVCSSCGASHPEQQLAERGMIRSFVPGFSTFTCPCCGHWNLATRDVPNPFASLAGGESGSRRAG